VLAFAHGLPVAISAVYSVNSSFIFIDHFKFSPTSYAYIQLIPVMINLIGSIIYRHHVLTWGVSKSIRFGLSLCTIFLSLTILGVMFDILQIPVSIVLIMCVLNLSLSSVIASSGTKAIEYTPKLKGLAVAFLGLLRNGVVAILVLVVGAFFNGTIIPVYIGMAILTAILIFLLLPYSKELPSSPEN
jgi:DHA1 family bicyclomycin/chloramphenicol resistance-like MFS transporter